MTHKRFVEMAKALRFTDDNGKVDYNYIATMLHNYKIDCANEAEQKGYMASRDGYIKDAQLIDSFQDTPQW